ncbi:tyrosine-type recombinase/integrase [Streptococcus pseudopneumoniae]|uniref:tyrosine-type recombinase/integrase n=1 Tax=Streptococcus pseudopneumoniae TaxID=257758 RepID=UPI0039F0E9E6
MNIVEPIRDKDDIQAMKDYLREWNERNYILFLFGINSGLRVGDILKIRVKDVQGRYIKLKEQKTGKKKKIKMTKTLKREVREYIQNKPHHHFLFQSRVGKNKPLDRRTVDWILKVAASECGIENIGTHSMRKTFGYHYYKKTKDIAMLMSLFNHSSPAITLRYIGIRQDQQDKAMSNFGL